MHEWLATEALPEARMTLARLDDSTDVRDAAAAGSVPALVTAESRVRQARSILRAGLAALCVAGTLVVVQEMLAGPPEVVTWLLIVATATSIAFIGFGIVATLGRRRAAVVARVVCVVEREYERNSVWTRDDIRSRFLVRFEERSGRRDRRRVSPEFFEAARPGTFLLLYEHAGAIVSHRRLGAMTDALP